MGPAMHLRRARWWWWCCSVLAGAVGARRGGAAGAAGPTLCTLPLCARRLWVRNLGRDDRLIADHGREGRHPFLDEALMAHVLQLPLWQVADLTRPPGGAACWLAPPLQGQPALSRVACSM